MNKMILKLSVISCFLLSIAIKAQNPQGGCLDVLMQNASPLNQLIKSIEVQEARPSEEMKKCFGDIAVINKDHCLIQQDKMIKSLISSLKNISDHCIFMNSKVEGYSHYADLIAMIKNFPGPIAKITTIYDKRILLPNSNKAKRLGNKIIKKANKI